MQYHIQTDPIWEAFKSDCDCPLCAIYEKTESRLVEQYLNEAVMEPDYRVEVNKYGFCAKHLKKQLQCMDTCVICRTADENMTRYAYTVAQMFACEPEFRQVFQKSNGFCMPHYTLLLAESNKAGKLTEIYLHELVYLQNKSLDRTVHDLDRFAQIFDYRNAGSAVRPDPDTIPDTIRKLKGRII